MHRKAVAQGLLRIGNLLHFLALTATRGRKRSFSRMGDSHCLALLITHPATYLTCALTSVILCSAFTFLTGVASRSSGVRGKVLFVGTGGTGHRTVRRPSRGDGCWYPQGGRTRNCQVRPSASRLSKPQSIRSVETEGQKYSRPSPRQGNILPRFDDVVK